MRYGVIAIKFQFYSYFRSRFGVAVCTGLQYRVKSLSLGRVFHASPHQTSYHYYFQPMMPRQPLSEISNNLNYRGGVRGRFELTSIWRSHIVGRAAGGQVPKTIADNLRIPPTTVHITLSQIKSRYDNKSLH